MTCTDVSRLPRDEMRPRQDETRESERADLRLRHDDDGRGGGQRQPSFLERTRLFDNMVITLGDTYPWMLVTRGM